MAGDGSLMPIRPLGRGFKTSVTHTTQASRESMSTTAESSFVFHRFFHSGPVFIFFFPLACLRALCCSPTRPTGVCMYTATAQSRRALARLTEVRHELCFSCRHQQQAATVRDVSYYTTAVFSMYVCILVSSRVCLVAASLSDVPAGGCVRPRAQSTLLSFFFFCLHKHPF